jgi:hypothetical protein
MNDTAIGSLPEPSTNTLKRSASSFLSNSVSSRDATRTFSASAFVAAAARCAVVRPSAPTVSFWRAVRRRVGASASLSAAVMMQSAKESCMVVQVELSCAARVEQLYGL